MEDRHQVFHLDLDWSHSYFSKNAKVGIMVHVINMGILVIELFLTKKYQ